MFAHRIPADHLLKLCHRFKANFAVVELFLGGHSRKHEHSKHQQSGESHTQEFFPLFSTKNATFVSHGVNQKRFKCR